MNGWLPTVLQGGFSAAVLLSLVAYVRDRRRTRAEGDVAQGSAPFLIHGAAMSNLSQQIELMKRGFDAERASLMSALAIRDAQLADLRADLSRKDIELELMRTQVQRMQKEMDTLRERIDGMLGKE